MLFPPRDDKSGGRVYHSKDYDSETTMGMRKEVWKIDLWTSAIRCVGTFPFRDARTQITQGSGSSASYSSFALADRRENSIYCNETLMTLTKPSFTPSSTITSVNLKLLNCMLILPFGLRQRDLREKFPNAFTNLRRSMCLSIAFQMSSIDQ